MEKPIVLITGASGMTGSRLARYICTNAFGTAIGVLRPSTSKRPSLPIPWVSCDLREAGAVKALVKKVRPDMVFHLAAQSEIPLSWAAPLQTMEDNLFSTLHLLETLRRVKPSARILLAGSSEEYGEVSPRDLPIQEAMPLKPLNPYAVSKVGADFYGWQYFKNYGLAIVRARSFNCLGGAVHKRNAPNQWAERLVQIERGKARPLLPVGNLEAKRDFLDVEDIVRAYWLLMTQGEPGEVYNIASGKAVALKELLEKMLRLVSVKVRVQQDPRRLRPSDVPLVVGDNSKLKKQTGWKPKISLDQSLQSILDFWRERIKTGSSAPSAQFPSSPFRKIMIF